MPCFSVGERLHLVVDVTFGLNYLFLLLERTLRVYICLSHSSRCVRPFVLYNPNYKPKSFSSSFIPAAAKQPDQDQ